MKAWRSLVIHEILAQVWFIIGSLIYVICDLCIYLVIISSVPKFMSRISICNNWQNPHSASLVFGVKVLLKEKTKGKSPKFHTPPSLASILSKIQHHIVGIMAEVNYSLKEQKYSNVIVPSYLHLVHLSGSYKNHTDLWGWN